jgi:hypothetical protein
VETSKKPKIEEAHVSKSSFNSKITVSPPTTQDTCGSQTRSTRDNVSILPTLSSIVVLAQKGGVKQWKRSAIGNLCESQVGGSHKNAQRSLEVPKENRLVANSGKYGPISSTGNKDSAEAVEQPRRSL